ncbi:MAG TPA: M67 family metallopeptidase [Rhizomicrobium sp.]|jgi:proteasome lid subunit RPN8/RPN11
MRVLLPGELRRRLFEEARTAHPAECCGLLEGKWDGDLVDVLALHPARNLALGIDRFDIHPKDHIAAQKAARGRGHAIIGCYHSHPHSRAEPSAADLAGAGEEEFLWLIAGGESLNAFVYRRGRFTGADWVTSSP